MNQKHRAFAKALQAMGYYLYSETKFDYADGGAKFIGDTSTMRIAGPEGRQYIRWAPRQEEFTLMKLETVTRHGAKQQHFFIQNGIKTPIKSWAEGYPMILAALKERLK